MKTEHLTLPTLQVAAALFFASRAQAETLCLDANDVVVDDSNCDGTAPPATFFVVAGVIRGDIGGTIAGTIDVKIDSTDRTALAAANLVSGGFGMDNDNEDQASGGS